MFAWTPALSTHEPLLDEQHQELFRRFEAIRLAMEEHRTLYGVYALTLLKHFARDHFASEEALMAEAGYPRLAAHREEHEKFRARLDKLVVRSIGQDVTPEILALLQDWLTNHIAKSDLDYTPWLEKLRNKS